MNQVFQSFADAGIAPWMDTFGPWLIPILIWSLVWKGVALWHAARRGEKKWFIALLMINTVGLLEILYLSVFAKPKTLQLPPLEKSEKG